MFLWHLRIFRITFSSVRVPIPAFIRLARISSGPEYFPLWKIYMYLQSSFGSLLKRWYYIYLSLVFFYIFEFGSIFNKYIFQVVLPFICVYSSDIMYFAFSTVSLLICFHLFLFYKCLLLDNFFSTIHFYFEWLFVLHLFVLHGSIKINIMKIP